MSYRKQYICIVSVMGLLYVLAFGSLRIRNDEYSSLINCALQHFRCLIYTGNLIVWCVSVRRRILNRHVCSCMIAVGLLMIFWLVIRTIKWEFLPDNCLPHRLCWYAYYIPIILIPLIGVFIIQYLGRPDDYRLPKYMNYLWIPAAALMLCVLTNDIHRLVFDFPNGIYNYNDDYNYQPVFFVILGWSVGLGLYFAVMLIRKSRVCWSRFRWLPVFIVIGGAAYTAAYCMRLVVGDMTVVNCTFITLLCESAIQCGLIRSNMGYRDIFYESDAMLQITDQTYHVMYASHAAPQLSEEIMRSLQEGPVVFGNIRIQSTDICGGHVIWAEDISEFNRLTEALKKSRDRLSKNNELLKAELKLKENQVRMEQQQQLYERVRSEVAPRLDLLEELLQDGGEEDIRKKLSHICVVGAFVKRRSNLILLYHDGSKVSAKELEYCLRESADNLRLYGIMCALTSRCEGELPVELLVNVYDYFEETAEKNLSGLVALLIRLECSESRLELMLQMGTDREPYFPELTKALKTLNSTVTIRRQENDSVISLCIPTGGEQT